MKFEPFLESILKRGFLELRRAVDLDDVAVGIEQEGENSTLCPARESVNSANHASTSPGCSPRDAAIAGAKGLSVTTIVTR
jgi:hypothetical protein